MLTASTLGPTDAPSATIAEVREWSGRQAYASGTVAPAGLPKFTLMPEISISVAEMEAGPMFSVVTGETIVPRDLAGRPALVKEPPEDLAARSARDRVALLARKFAKGRLSDEDQARMAVATSRIEKAFARVNAAAFEHVSDLAERAVKDLAEGDMAIQQLTEMGL